MKLLRMSPGHGDVLLAEGDPSLEEDAERLIEEFRRQLDLGMWAAVPSEGAAGHREATLVRDFDEIPRGAERVIFFPQAAGGAVGAAGLAAERRARELLRSVAGDEAAEMYERLGFVRIDMSAKAGPGPSTPGREAEDVRLTAEEPAYGYLLYPHRPIVAYDARSGEPLSEFCVRFPDGESTPEWLPDADDVLAKWIALSADERGVIGEANIDPLGHQLDPEMVRRDLEAAREWEATA